MGVAKSIGSGRYLDRRAWRLIEPSMMGKVFSPHCHKKLGF